MSTDHLSLPERTLRLQGRQIALNNALNQLIGMCRLKLLDRESIVDQAAVVTSLAVSVKQTKAALDQEGAQ